MISLVILGSGGGGDRGPRGEGLGVGYLYMALDIFHFKIIERFERLSLSSKQTVLNSILSAFRDLYLNYA